MAPKTKKAAPKEAAASKKGKGGSKKGGGDENGTRGGGRASKRNADKVVVYKEVDEKVDERASEGQPRKVPVAAQAKRGAKKARRTRGSDSEDSSSAEDSADEDFTPKVKPPPKEKAEKKEPAKKGKSDGERTNKTETDFDAIDFGSDKKTADGKPWNIKISSWNVGGLRSWMKKGAMDFIQHEDPDIFCIQDVRCSESKLPPEVKVDGYHAYWLASDKEGYAGMGLYSKEKPIEVKYGLDIKDHDTEGRVITAEYSKFFLVGTYVPNSGRGLVTLPKRLKWDPDLRSYLRELDDKKPVILCGDLNVSHQPIDLANPKTNTKSAGFTQEERDGMSELLKDGFVDSYRHLNPDKTGAYTFWTYMGNARSRNVGWRLDYFIVSEKLVPNLCDNLIRSEVYGSDHCPITLLVNV